MLKIEVPESELYDERINSFLTIKAQTLELEHSLLSISKWEERWEKPFFSREPKTNEETIDYVRCMTINQVDPMVYFFLPSDAFERINQYFERSMTATTIRDLGGSGRSREIITSEIIYYLMFSYGISKECESWPLNRLITLIRVFNIKNTPQKKMSKNEILRQNRALNEARKAKLHTRG